MSGKKKTRPVAAPGFHPRSKHGARYDLAKLTASSPDLAPFVIENKYKDASINFFDPKAVHALNKALLKHYYGIDVWDLPEGYLCPGVPGRADYLHHIADVLGNCNRGTIPTGRNVRCLDIGVGSSCIYPIVGRKEYGWSFVGTDIDQVALESAEKIVASNPILRGSVELRRQPEARRIFSNVFHDDDYFDLTICNPPFYASMEEVEEASFRKQRNLEAHKSTFDIRNFKGQNSELWCAGGEKQFLKDMVYQSKKFALSTFWFSTLVSKKSNLKSIYAALNHNEAVDVETLPMGRGNKMSRIVAWTFLPREKQAAWMKGRWHAG